MEVSGVYKIQSKTKPYRCYIGSACDLRERQWRHFRKLRYNKHFNKKLQNHYNKYGENDLEFSVILYGCSKTELIFVEQCFIDTYNPWFNICPTAGNRLGCKCREDTKKKLRGKKSKEFKERMRIMWIDKNRKLINDLLLKYGYEPIKFA
jgi:group I intron endonuclease